MEAFPVCLSAVSYLSRPGRFISPLLRLALSLAHRLRSTLCKHNAGVVIGSRFCRRGSGIPHWGTISHQEEALLQPDLPAFAG